MQGSGAGKNPGNWQNHGRTGPRTTTDLEDVVSCVAERMLPEINKTIETIISKRLDTSEDSQKNESQQFKRVISE